MAKAVAIGYLEGADPVWLTTLIANACDTLPVSNGYDGHGKNIMLFNSRDKVDIVIGYLHKVIAPEDNPYSTRDILHPCLTYGIPVLLAVPANLQDAVKNLIKDLAPGVTLVPPENMVDEVLRRVQGQQPGGGTAQTASK